MSHRFNPSNPISNIAATLTDHALRVARNARIDGDSVALELQLWKALTGQLERAVGLQAWLPYKESVVLNGTLHHVIQRAVTNVAQEQGRVRNPRELESLIRPLVAAVSFSTDERRELARQFPSGKSTTWRRGRSGTVRGLQFAART